MTILAVLEAFTEYAACRADLDRRMAEYDGYSPGWAFSEQIHQRAMSEKKAGEALATYIAQAVEPLEHRIRALEGNPR